MTLYEAIYNFLIGLFPSDITSQCLSWVNLASLVIMSLLLVVAISFVVWCFNILGKAFKL